MRLKFSILKEELEEYVNQKMSPREIGNLYNVSDSTIRKLLKEYNLKTKCSTKKITDITGKKYGKLTVIEFIENNSGKNMWLCECDCEEHNQVAVWQGNLHSGQTTSCGCIRIENLIGQKFGRLTVVKKAPNKTGRVAWCCKCNCGNEDEIIVVAHSLKQGSTLSCGCLNAENKLKHGMSKSRIYRIYRGMKDRCFNSNKSEYKYYGERGVTICDEWLDKENGFINFYNWAMNNGYRDNLEIERLDVEGDYEPNNCAWITHFEQMSNTRQNVFVEINGEVKTVAEWSRVTGLEENTIRIRLKKGEKGETLIRPSKRSKINNISKEILYETR
jgi:CRISPR/Cas system CSM-associated protein Csm2 small subunit